MSCVMYESDAVRLRPAVDVLVVTYSVFFFKVQRFFSVTLSRNKVRSLRMIA